jgi:adenylyltransferase/sulfurtransferase
VPLNHDEITRYQRHLSLAGFGPVAQEKLKRSSVLVIGAGGLGCPALLYLAAAGVGRIGIVDSDRVELSNLQRQVLFGTADAGKPKVEAAAARLRALNPLIAIEPHEVRFTRDNALELVRAHDLVVDGSDNFATRYLVNDACVIARRPLVYGAIQGFEGQVSVFNWQDGPTYRCLFPEPPEPGTVPSCNENGVLGVLPGMIGTMQASEAIKIMTGIGEPLSGRLFLFNALSMTTSSLSLTPDPQNKKIKDLPPAGYGETCALPTGAPDEIEATELRALIAAGQTPQLIDVREGWELELAKIDPSRHAPVGQIERGNLAGLEGLDPKAPTVVYCAHGMRSLRAMNVLKLRHGFEHISSLKGGQTHWATGQ